MGYGWDVDDDYLDDEDDEDEDDEDEEDEENEDGFGDDVEDGFGEEDNPDEEGEGDDKDDEKKKEEEEEKAKKDDKKGDGKGGKGKEDPTNPKVLKKLAKRFGYPPEIMPFPCPECKKMTLFLDKTSRIFIRGVLSCIPYTSFAVPKDKVVKFVCLNKKCKTYWPTWGVKYTILNGKFSREKNIFHVTK